MYIIVCLYILKLLSNFDFLYICLLSIIWIKSYLLDRNQCISFKENVSEKLPIETGVPQGSIPGPLLFIVLSMIFPCQSQIVT